MSEGTGGSKRHVKVTYRLSLDGLLTKPRRTREQGRNVRSMFGNVALGVSVCEGLWEQRWACHLP